MRDEVIHPLETAVRIG